MTRSHKVGDSQTRKTVDAKVAICTWKRARLLDQSLSAMREQRIPTDVEREFLIVNNNCADLDCFAALAMTTCPTYQSIVNNQLLRTSPAALVQYAG